MQFTATRPHNTTQPIPTETQSVDWLRLLNELSRTINLASKDLDQTLQQLMNRLITECGIDGVAIWTAEEDTDFMKILASAGLSERYVRFFNKTDRIRVGQGLVGRVMTNRKTQSVRNLAEYEHVGVDRWNAMLREEGVISILAAPMFVGERLIGSFNIYYKAEHIYSHPETLFIEALANHISITLQNLKHDRELERDREKLAAHVDRLHTMQHVIQQIIIHIDESVETSLSFLGDYLAGQFKSKALQIFIYDAEDHCMSLRSSYGASPAFQAYMSSLADAPERASVLDQVVQSKTGLFSSRVFTDEHIQKETAIALSKEGFVGMAAIPLIVQERVVGVLAIYYGHVHRFSSEEQSVLSTLSQFLSVAIENSQIFQSLAQEKQKTAAIVYSLHDGLLVFDLDGRIIEINPCAEEMLQLAKEDVLGLMPRELATDDLRLINLKQLTTVTLGDYEDREFELPEPIDKTLRISQVPLQADRVKIGTVLILKDITREKLMEQLKSNFVSTASHQLRTPLTGIKWGLEALMRHSQFDEQQLSLVRRIFSNVDNVIQLINDLLDVSRLEEGRVEYTFKPHDLGALMQELEENVSINIEEHDLTFTVEKPKRPLPKLCIDKTKLSIALKNLIDNAIKYTPEGGSVRVRVSRQKESAIITVSDTGIGIPQDAHRYLFNKFFRAENAVQHRTEGSGLGLYIAKNIIEKHRGRITVDSQEGRGTTFIVQLPLSPTDLNGAPDKEDMA